MKFYSDEDAELSLLEGKTVGFVGYGNQGRSQALNLRDSGVSVIVGNPCDSYADQAKQDGMEVVTIAEAVRRSDIIPILIPDELQPDVYAKEIAPNLRPGQALDFAHGYNIHFGLIRPPAEVDVILVAPRMIGVQVRRSFELGGGVPAFVGVWQDATKTAWDTALAFAKGIGATRAGVIPSTFQEETELDLFSEQALWPVMLGSIVASFELLVTLVYSPEAVVMELYGSGEGAEVFREMVHTGFFRQMKFHSQTSQYGMLTSFGKLSSDDLKQNFQAALDRIRSGTFAREFLAEQRQGYPVFRRLREQAIQHPLNDAEDRLRPVLESTFKAGGHGGAASAS